MFLKQILGGVKEIYSTRHAFAAVADGRLVTWGNELGGGDCSPVADQLGNVQKVFATDCAFAALLDDQRVVTWGEILGGSARVQDQLRDVQDVCTTDSWLQQFMLLTQFSRSSGLCFAGFLLNKNKFTCL